jgi:hypothetical protein
MSGTTRQLIKEREILPRLTLPRIDGGGQVSLPGQQASLLVFAHPDPCDECARYLDELAGSVDDLRGWATRLLAVTGADGDDADDHPFPLLRDEDGAARRRIGLGGDEAAVILADRWGEVFEVATFGPDHGFPLPRELVESAKIVDLSCGECNVPGPEWRTDE